MNRREFLKGCTLSAVAAVSGCKHALTEDGMKKIAYAFGGTTGFALDQYDIDEKSRDAIIDIVGRGYTVVPDEGQTVLDVWKAVAKQHVDALVDDARITATQGDLILSAFDLVLKGIALLVERYPDVGTYGSLTTAAVEGFCSGFLAVYKPAASDEECTDCCEECTIDVKTFKALKRSAEAGKVSISSRGALEK